MNTHEGIKKPFIVRVTDVPEWYEEASTLPEMFDFVRKEIDKVHETYPDIKVLLSLKDIEEIAC